MCNHINAMTIKLGQETVGLCKILRCVAKEACDFTAIYINMVQFVLLCDMFELLNAMTTKLCLEAVVFRKLMSFDVKEACDFITIYSNLVRFDVADAMCFGFSMR